MKERTILKIFLGIAMVAVLSIGSVIVTAMIQEKNPLDLLKGEEKAKVIASSAVSGRVIEIEAKGVADVYEVEIETDEGEKEVVVDTVKKEVISIEAEEEDEESDVPITGSALDRAKAAALEVVCGGDSSCDARVTDTELGDEESYYEVEIQYNGREIDVQLDEDFNFVGYD